MTQAFLAEAVGLTSITKSLLCALALLAWALWATVVDKDAEFYRLPRRMWNGIQLGSAGLAFLAVFLIPFFIAGYIFGLAAMIGAGSAYAIVRNKAVADKDKWKLNAEFFLNIINTKRQQRAEKAANLRFKSAAGAPPDLKPVPLHTEERYAAHLQIEEVLEAALARHAQGFTLKGNDSGFGVTLSIDGMDYRQAQLPAPEAMAAIDYLKMHCAMETAERRKPMTGQCKIESGAHGNHDLLVTTMGSTKGIQCSVVFDPVKQITIPFKELGLTEQQQAMLDPIMKSERGVVLVATPPQQGRTTTLYAFTQAHDPYTLDIHIIEAEVQKELDSVTSHKVEPAEQSRKLHSLLIRDPHVVTMSNISDSAAAKKVSEGGSTNKRIYAGIKAENAMAAIQLWMKAVGDNEQVAKSLVAVVSQRLIRKLCPYCRVKYKPNPEQLKKLNLPAQKIKELYKMGGKIVVKNDETEPCPACHGVGYQGRTAAFEVLVTDDDESRKLIAAGDLGGLRSHLRRKKTFWMEETALQKCVAGITSIAEAMRAMGQEKEPAQAKPGAAAQPKAAT